jgi:hypothetical protein
MVVRCVEFQEAFFLMSFTFVFRLVLPKDEENVPSVDKRGTPIVVHPAV